MITPFEFGQKAAHVLKRAMNDAEMRAAYQRSGQAGTMSYEDFRDAYADDASAAAPTAPTPAAKPATPAQPQGGFFSRMGAKADSALAVPGQAAKSLYNWGTRPIGQSYPEAFKPKPPKPNPQWEAQRQNFEGAMF
jgi:hypothetical protein